MHAPFGRPRHDQGVEPVMVQVVAPCDMEAGFSFPANYGERTFPVTVPRGGIKRGQVFEVPLPGDFSSERTPFLVISGASEDPYLGKWKDSLFDCSMYGLFHPSFCNAIFCPQILMAQVLTRLKMNWLGEENVPDCEWRQTFRRIFLLVCFYWILSTILAPPAPLLSSDPIDGKVIVTPPPQTTTQPAFFAFLYKLLSWSFGIYTLLVLTRLRRAVRRKYEIPLYRPSWGALGHLEDCCLAFFCGCCTVSQVARRTCDYSQQAAAACSPTGLGSQSHFLIV